MQKIVIHCPGGYERLMLEQHPNPEPGPGEVLIEVVAIGVNYADCLIRMGLYASARKYIGYPITPGFEVAGRVASLGEGVTGIGIGDEVMAITLFGGYSSRLVVPQAQLFALPSGMDMAQAAAFPTAFLTAWFALFELAHPHPGDAILVHSAAGGVGSALIQLGKLAGCRMIGVVGRAEKVAACRAMGADEVIDKSSKPLWREAERLSPAGYGVVFDANGASTLRQSYNHLAPTGRLVAYGFHSSLPQGRGRPDWLKLAWDWLRIPRFNPLQLTTDNRSLLAFNLSFLSERDDLLLGGMRQLLEWYGEGKLRLPQVTRYPMREVVRAHRDLESGTTTGKLLLMVEE